MPETPNIVLYIHGFASSGLGHKAELLRAHYAERQIRFLAPSLSHIPELAVATLEEMIATCGRTKVRLIGASLGGFYAAYLSGRFGIPSVLVNPVMRLEASHGGLVGLQRHAYDGSRFECSTRHLETLERCAERMEKPALGNVLLLLQKGDDDVDYRHTLDYFDGLPPRQIVLEEDGSHLFEGLENKLEQIDAFLGLTTYNPSKKETGT